MKDTIELVDKPLGFSSFQVVRIFKRRYKKVGHAGTLDPFATGLLIILLDHSTKEFLRFQSLDKEYKGEFIIGYQTDTYDITGKITKRTRASNIFSLEELSTRASALEGEIEQRVPPFSALKQHGQRFYQLSRRGLKTPSRKRRVHIESFVVNGYNHPLVTFTAVVGKGTYVRALVHDFGKLLGCGAVLTGLRRTRIGSYSVSSAYTLGEILERG